MEKAIPTVSESVATSGEVSLPILIPTAIIFVLTVFGLWGNGCIVFATLRNKNLQTVCNWLICFTSIADFIHQVGHATIFYFVLTGQNIVQLRYCYYWQFIPVFCMNLGVYYTLTVGLDRLLIVVYPTSHPFMSKRVYLSLVLIVGFIYSTVLLAIGYYEMLKTPDKEVVCVIMIELYQGVAKTIWVVITVILVNMVVVIYASRVTCLLLNVDNKTLTYVLLYSAIATNLGCSANYYVYYWISSDYRSALKKQLDFMLCRGWKIVRISNTNNPGLANSSIVRSSRVSKSALSVAQQHNGSLQMPPPNIPE
uniref:G-protein coupled receptors family 1 profile domain-containing protein n=1 Tax=Acrobeloides nanus TaxID=290746 RepID=A0A914BZD8_9BILA